MSRNNSRVFVYVCLVVALFSVVNPSIAEEFSAKGNFPLDKNYSYNKFIEDKKRAKSGDAKSQFFMGIIYENQMSNFVKKCYCKAFEWYKKASKQGHIQASHRLGIMYQEGRCSKIDFEKAKSLFQFAAGKSFEPSEYSLGRLYYKGLGVSKNYSTALKWFMKADKKDYFVATYAIGIAYKMGNGVKKDYEKAFEWFMRSANLGYEDGMTIIALMYLNGHGVDKDISKAISWYQKAIEKKSITALNGLAWLRATHPETKYRDGEAAVNLSLNLIKVGGETFKNLDTLAAAYAENRDFKNAIKWQKIAVHKINMKKERNTINQYLERLELYKQNKSWIQK